MRSLRHSAGTRDEATRVGPLQLSNRRQAGPRASWQTGYPWLGEYTPTMRSMELAREGPVRMGTVVNGPAARLATKVGRLPTTAKQR